MNINETAVLPKKRREIIINTTFCSLLAAGVIWVLLCVYDPGKNTLGALGSVCMDVICLAILLILVLSLTFEVEEKSITTRIFLGLMQGTMLALFFDLLNWALDGSLAFGDWTYVFTLSSLCMGSILAGSYILYLSFYMNEMYGLSRVFKTAKVLALLDLFAFCLTVVLALTKNAFVYVDGHYEIGELYDYVTAIPVLTLFYLTGYVIWHVKIIGSHDVIAVAGYILTMIAGALIEGEFRIGATYVSVAIADVFIFLMLQNKYIDRVKKQREMLAEKITSQYEILESMAGIYSYINYIDLEAGTAGRFNSEEGVTDHLDLEKDPHTSLIKGLYEDMEDALKEKFWAYTDLSTLSDRMKGEKIISSEFCHKKDGWFRAHYIRIGESVNEPIKRVIYAIRNIDEEKKVVEKWIRKSNTDELTLLNNRHAYEDDVTALSESRLKDNFVYVSIDVNGLKTVNDFLGHEAGDELLVGASECMKQCFGAYGKLYRTGGDEFVALIHADEVQLSAIKKDIEDVTENWKGKAGEKLAMSIGYVSRKEVGDISIEKMADLADKRMYEAKTKYYQNMGIDRRGRRDANAILGDRLIKMNLFDETYQVVNVNDEEQIVYIDIKKIEK